MARIVKDPEERRAEFITTAQQLFFSKGYERTSVNDIIHAVGVSKGAFYHYFDSKTAVLEAIVDEAVVQTQAILQDIVADEKLTAIDKWQQVMQATGNWKVARKAELIEMGRFLMMDENVLLQYKLRTKVFQTTAAELAKIIAQGVAEGVFTTRFVAEAAEIVLAIVTTLGDNINQLLFNPDQYDDPTTLALRKKMAVETAVERVLGAPAGSLPIGNQETLIAWFTD